MKQPFKNSNQPLSAEYAVGLGGANRHTSNPVTVLSYESRDGIGRDDVAMWCPTMGELFAGVKSGQPMTAHDQGDGNAPGERELPLASPDTSTHTAQSVAEPAVCRNSMQALQPGKAGTPLTTWGDADTGLTAVNVAPPSARRLDNDNKEIEELLAHVKGGGEARKQRTVGHWSDSPAAKDLFWSHHVGFGEDLRRGYDPLACKKMDDERNEQLMELGQAKPCAEPGPDGPQGQLTDREVRARSGHQVPLRREIESLATNNLWSTKRALAATAARVSGCEGARHVPSDAVRSSQSADRPRRVLHADRKRVPSGLMAHPVWYENSPFRRGDEGSPETTPSSALAFYLGAQDVDSRLLIPTGTEYRGSRSNAYRARRYSVSDEQILLTSKQLTELWLLSMNCARSSAEVGSKQRVVSGAAGLNSMDLGVIQAIGCQPERDNDRAFEWQVASPPATGDFLAAGPVVRHRRRFGSDLWDFEANLKQPRYDGSGSLGQSWQHSPGHAWGVRCWTLSDLSGSWHNRHSRLSESARHSGSGGHRLTSEGTNEIDWATQPSLRGGHGRHGLLNKSPFESVACQSLTGRALGRVGTMKLPRLARGVCLETFMSRVGYDSPHRKARATNFDGQLAQDKGERSRTHCGSVDKRLYGSDDCRMSVESMSAPKMLRGRIRDVDVHGGDGRCRLQERRENWFAVTHALMRRAEQHRVLPGDIGGQTRGVNIPSLGMNDAEQVHITTVARHKLVPAKTKRLKISRCASQLISGGGEPVQRQMNKRRTVRRPIPAENGYGQKSRCLYEHSRMKDYCVQGWAEAPVHYVSRLKKSVLRSTTKREDRMVC